MSNIRLMIIDDHALIRGALAHALGAAFGKVSISEAGSLQEGMAQLEGGKEFDIILLDLLMPGVQGLSGLLYLRTEHPSIPVVIVSASDDIGVIRSCMEFGASGYVPKSQPIERIREAIESVLAGNLWTPPEIELNADSTPGSDLAASLSTLTPQQVRVLMMLGEGLLNKQIAYKLGVSEATIKAHVSAILQKLGVDSRTQAVIAVNKLNAGSLPKPMA